jgi:hypothetical protein
MKFMRNKKINKKINLLLNEVSGEDVPAAQEVPFIPQTPAQNIPSIGAPGVPSGTPPWRPAPYIVPAGTPPELWGDPSFWFWLTTGAATWPVTGTQGVVIDVLQNEFVEIEDMLDDERERRRERIRPKSSGEDDNGFDIYPGFAQPTRIPKNLIKHLPKFPTPGWQNYFQNGGGWWYAPHHSPNNPNHNMP